MVIIGEEVGETHISAWAEGCHIQFAGYHAASRASLIQKPTTDVFERRLGESGYWIDDSFNRTCLFLRLVRVLPACLWMTLKTRIVTDESVLIRI